VADSKDASKEGAQSARLYRTLDYPPAPSRRQQLLSLDDPVLSIGDPARNLIARGSLATHTVA
jgi:hypothetical protein